MRHAVVAPSEDVRRHVSHPIDVHVGARMRLRRRFLGMSQTKLGVAIGITFQQVQKFERGTSRIAASRLHDVSRALDVPVSFFFDALPAEPGGLAVVSPGQGNAEARNDLQPGEMHGRETLDLVRAYYTLADPAVRKRILELVRSLAPAG
ncbi:helix-turn-helix domain-containing protein [Neoroseomonas oryzicola]|uniref:Helix-turn-helix transcriptional regulator n=1 Tax=Neoroseomonas oryzicola TaxID=535904 RepID=A0A9X9WPE8_9PROT|nr:helix-turn-helix transcriptional regulator [Neoroseomonas oryzicola]MBR0662208.1 helix-turn-helix transcriptional regulator [Neoroseomonas oryzicola]NKE20229.1 helix-turn-helix transcriptional regulator [Neoroseomonas oryzicola]